MTKGAPFEVEYPVAADWLKSPINPNGLLNTEVIRPILSGGDLVKRRPTGWVVDFTDLNEHEASFFEGPFEYVERVVKPLRDTRQRWWLFAEPRPGFRGAVANFRRYLATPKVARHRPFTWLDTSVLPDNLIVAVSRDDDPAFGILQSRFHEAWAIQTCAWTGVGNDATYTPTTTFETFPFLEGLTPNIAAPDYAGDPRAIRIAAVAKRLDELRRAWLNPPDLVVVEPEVVPGYPDRILPKDAAAAVILKGRTLTKLYNERPTWLANAHAELDRAVAAAYGWPEDIAIDDALARLLALNLERSAAGR